MSSIRNTIINQEMAYGHVKSTYKYTISDSSKTEIFTAEEELKPGSSNMIFNSCIYLSFFREGYSLLTIKNILLIHFGFIYYLENV